MYKTSCMKLITLLLFTLFSGYCHGQQTDSIYIKPLGWILREPENPTELDNSTFRNLKEGLQYSDKSDYRQLLLSRHRNYDPIVILGVSSQDIRFWCGINILTYSSFPDSYEAALTAMLQSLGSLNNTISFDTASSVETIDGLQFHQVIVKRAFQTFKLPPDITYWYYTFQNDYEFQVSITYADKETGEELLRIFRNSRFEKFRHVKSY